METEPKDPEEILNKFLNCCDSAKGTIDIPSDVRLKIYEYYKVYEKEAILDFLTKSVDYLGYRPAEHLKYDETKPYVYGYTFKLRDKSTGKIGFLEILPLNNSKIKWSLRSLHESYQALPTTLITNLPFFEGRKRF